MLGGYSEYVETCGLVDSLRCLLHAREGLISGALAEEARTNVVVGEQFEQAALRALPHVTFGHSAVVTLDFMREVDLVDFEQDRSDVTEDERHQLIELNVHQAANLGALFVLATLYDLIMQRQHIARHNCLETVAGAVVGVLELSDLDQRVQEHFIRHVRLVGIHLHKYQVHSLLVHQLVVCIAPLDAAALIILCHEVYMGVVQHLVELLRFEVARVKSVSVRRVVLEDLAQPALCVCQLLLAGLIWFLLLVCGGRILWRRSFTNLFVENDARDLWWRRRGWLALVTHRAIVLVLFFAAQQLLLALLLQILLFELLGWSGGLFGVDLLHLQTIHGFLARHELGEVNRRHIVILEFISRLSNGLAARVGLKVEHVLLLRAKRISLRFAVLMNSYAVDSVRVDHI